MVVLITLPDGSKLEFAGPVIPLEVAVGISKRLARQAVAAEVNGDLWDLKRPIEADAEVRILTFDDKLGASVYRHSTAHVMAAAVSRLFPDAGFAIGPAIDDGFYYDFDLKRPLSDDDLEQIEQEMKKIIKEDIPFKREVLPRAEALKFFKERGQKYKVELIEELPEDERVSIYYLGQFIDLCRGPHLPSTGSIKAIKLLSVSGAYWRGDENREMLQRIYGTAFDKKSRLDEYLKRLEEAKLRDHRRLGKELDLFSIHDDVGSGLVLWHPKGALIREIIEDFWRKEHRRRGYEIVRTPHIAKTKLWEISGHLEWYGENMYPPMDVDGSKYMVKPMNCPFHILMYKSKMRSYRDLPIRWGELASVYRYERSGVLHGLLRVRGFTQDDAHIFCRRDQLEDEIVGVMELAQYMMKSFGYDEYAIKLSVRDPNNKEKYIGSEEVWEMAVKAIKGALERMHLPYEVDEGEAKFYGPAIDIKLFDALGREWQGPTIQVDFNEPERFGMKYIGQDGEEHVPVMIHRTVLGSMERFVGGLIEHHGGAFPVWLSPVQVKVLPIADRHHDYAKQIARKLEQADIRVELDDRNEKIGYKIRSAEVEKVPYMLIIGDKEQENGTVAVRKRHVGDVGESDLASVIAEIEDLVDKKE